MASTKLISSLYLGGQHSKGLFSVFKPRYNTEYYRRLIAHQDSLKVTMTRRQRLDQLKTLENLEEDINEMLRLKNTDSPSKQDEENLRNQEEKVIPRILAIPNIIHGSVPNSEIVVDIIKPKSLREMPFKMLDHIKLSYINQCVYKSVVGPHSQYYHGLGAKMQLAIIDYFTHQLETKRNFNHYSGLCFVKSAVVEAVNSYDDKNYYEDCCRIIEEHSSDEHRVYKHLVETSRESCAAFISCCNLNPSVNEPLRMMSSGANYKAIQNSTKGKLVQQSDIVYCMSSTPSRTKDSTLEFISLRDLVWDCYKELAIPSRIVHCSAPHLKSNEHDAYRIDIWLPSEGSWSPVARISNYLNYLTTRLNLKRGHIIDSLVVDCDVLIKGIMENNQNSSGKFEIPLCLKKHLIDLNPMERDYFTQKDSDSYLHQFSASRTLHNYTSKRYLAKRSLFAHSKRFEKNTIRTEIIAMMFLFYMIMLAIMVDTKVIYSWLPEWFQRFTYNYIHRWIIRPVYWFFVYPVESARPDNDYYDDFLKKEQIERERMEAESKSKSRRREN